MPRISPPQASMERLSKAGMDVHGLHVKILHSCAIRAPADTARATPARHMYTWALLSNNTGMQRSRASVDVTGSSLTQRSHRVYTRGEAGRQGALVATCLHRQQRRRTSRGMIMRPRWQHVTAVAVLRACARERIRHHPQRSQTQAPSSRTLPVTRFQSVLSPDHVPRAVALSSAVPSEGAGGVNMTHARDRSHGAHSGTLIATERRRLISDDTYTWPSRVPRDSGWNL